MKYQGNYFLNTISVLPNMANSNLRQYRQEVKLFKNYSPDIFYRKDIASCPINGSLCYLLYKSIVTEEAWLASL